MDGWMGGWKDKRMDDRWIWMEMWDALYWILMDNLRTVGPGRVDGYGFSMEQWVIHR